MAESVGPSGDINVGIEGLELQSRRENLRRNSFLIGLAILLVLIAGSGALAFSRLEAFEREVRDRSSMNARHLAVALELQEQIGRVSAEARTYYTALALGATSFPARNRMRHVRDKISEVIEHESTSVLGQTEEWAEFREAYSSYAAELDTRQSPPAEDVALRRVENATAALVARIKENSRKLEEDAAQMRGEAQRDVLVTTAICFLAGLAISVLAFTETRRRIQEIERAAIALNRARQFAESVLDGMDSGVITVGEGGAVTSVNEPALHALGLPPEQEIIGKSVLDVLEQHPRLLSMIGPLLESNLSERRYLGRAELGRGAWLFDVGVSPIGGSQEPGFIVTLGDVTEAERANEELRRNRALTAVGQMTAQVAHEIKNPLGGVRLSAQLLERRLAEDPPSLELVQRIQNSIDHLARTVNELNQFARPSELKLEPVSLPELMDDLVFAVGDLVKEKAIRVERNYSSDVAEGSWDVGELRKALINFLGNAVDASENGSTVSISIARSDEPIESVSVTISDQGVGMSDETLKRLFEPFYTTKAHGTGLGMPIARKIIELHKGSVKVSSTLGEGTSVIVTLPFSPVETSLTGPLTAEEVAR